MPSDLFNWLMNLKLSAVLAILMLFGLPRAHGFALEGPNDVSYQTGALGYNGGRAPQTLGEEYRFNIPVLTYGFDSSFINYFGTNGIRAIEAAFRQVNDLPAVSLVTDQVLTNNFPLSSQGINPTATSLSLLDIRSLFLTDLVKYMGLSDAERYTWTLRSRWVIGTPSITNYVVIQKNYDPITRVNSDTVNGRRFSYVIIEDYYGQGTTDAVETDLSGFQAFGTSVASDLTLRVGGSFSSLTYDDMGGLRYIYATNNFNVENLLPSVAVTSTAASASTGSPWSPVGVTNILPVAGSGAVNVALRGGIDKVSFVRVDFDSLLGIGFVGVTNTWTDRYIASQSQNSVFQSQTLARPILQPDIIFSAADLGLGPNIPISYSRSVGNFINNDAINGQPGQNGPGLNVVPQLQVQFSTVLPYYLNQNPGFISGPFFGFSSGAFAFFDDTTIYQLFPDFLNLQFSDLERMLLEARSTIE